MPELAEVEFYRRRWHEAAAGQRITRVALHPGARALRGTDTTARSEEHTSELQSHLNLV